MSETGPRNSLREPAQQRAAATARGVGGTARHPASRPAARSGGAGRIVALLVVLAWALGATGFAVWGRVTADRLAAEQADLRQAYDDKVRALTRRLVGVASHQVLEQDGLSDQMADIIARQVDLENRQATLMQMAERLNAAGLPGAAVPPVPAATAREEDRGGARGRSAPAPADSAPTLRLGAPPAPDPSGPAGKPRADLDGGRSPPSRASRVLQAAAAGTLREQFAALQTSIGRVETGQVRLVGAVSSGIQHGIGTMRTTLGGLGLPVPDVTPAEAPGRAIRVGAGRPPADPFDEKVAALERDFVGLQRWKAAVDAAPLHRPVEGDNNLTSNFGTRKDPFTGEGRMHAGIDFRGPIGTPIRAAGAGRVITADATGGYGNLVEVEHGGGLVTRYAHLSSIQVAVGTTVAAGTVVGLLGSTGRSTGPHLHYETRLNGGPLDPMRFILAGAQLFNQPLPVDLTPDPASDDPTFD